MKLKVCILIILILAGFGVAQKDPQPKPSTKDYPRVASNGKRIQDFIPKNYNVVSQVVGDLNGDKWPDVALHIKGTSDAFITKLEYSEWDTNPRILLVLIREANGFRLAESTNVFIPAPDSPAMAEPFQGMSIVAGILRIDFKLWLSAGGWGATNASYKFRFQNERIFLIGADREDYMRNESESYKSSYNFLTHKVKETYGIREGIQTSNASAKKLTIRWRNLRYKDQPRLIDLGPAFAWEIEPGNFL